MPIWMVCMTAAADDAGHSHSLAQGIQVSALPHPLPPFPLHPSSGRSASALGASLPQSLLSAAHMHVVKMLIGIWLDLFAGCQPKITP